MKFQKKRNPACCVHVCKWTMQKKNRVRVRCRAKMMAVGVSLVRLFFGFSWYKHTRSPGTLTRAHTVTQHICTPETHTHTRTNDTHTHTPVTRAHTSLVHTHTPVTHSTCVRNYYQSLHSVCFIQSEIMIISLHIPICFLFFFRCTGTDYFTGLSEDLIFVLYKN